MRCCCTVEQMFPVEFSEIARDGAARAGIATTHRGTYSTPCFMPVGTRGAIKYLSASDYEQLGAQIVLGNTYHLMLRPGAETVAHFGGLGAFAGWGGLTLTDSGGFQVFHLTQMLMTMESLSNQPMTDQNIVSLPSLLFILSNFLALIFKWCSMFVPRFHLLLTLFEQRLNELRHGPCEQRIHTREMTNRCLALFRVELIPTCAPKARSVRLS